MYCEHNRIMDNCMQCDNEFLKQNTQSLFNNTEIEELKDQKKKMAAWMKGIGHNKGITYKNIIKGQCEMVQTWGKDCTCGLDKLLKEEK